RRESAFTYLSFRGAPRLEPAFKYLSFRIRFSGEESAFCRGAPSFRAFCERVGTFFKPRRGGCPHPPGWGLFSRSRTESAFTYLSFRGAPRREPAFKYLSFRIRFSGEESAGQRADRNDSRGAPGSRCLCETWDEKNYPLAPLKLTSLSDFQEQQSLFPPRSAMTSTECNESREPSRGLLAGGHPLPSLR